MKDYYFLLLINFNEFRLCQSNVEEPDFGCPAFVLSEEEYLYLLNYCNRCAND